MADMVYCYPESNVLINKLDIKEQDRFESFERRLTMLRLLELIDKSLKGNYDFKHLQSIHYYIFQDLFDWAGIVRTVDIAKGNVFCKAMFINDQAEVIFQKLRKERYLADLSQEELVTRLAYYFSEINALHPFREGNGRSQREFIRSLALKNGYIINYANSSKEEMILASQRSFLCDYKPMEELLKKCIRRQNTF